MQCELLRAPTGFGDDVLRFLAGNEAENTVLLGQALRHRRGPQHGTVVAVVRDNGAVRLAAIMSAPYPLLVSVGDGEAIPYLVEALRRAGLSPTDVSGPEPLVERFAATWRTGADVAIARAVRMMLYHADRITAPKDVAGELRVAGAADLEWLAGWQRRFAEQAGLSAAEEAADVRAILGARLARGEMFLWVVEGRPV